MTHPAIFTLLAAPLCSLGSVAMAAQAPPAAAKPASAPAVAPAAAQEPAQEPAQQPAQQPAAAPVQLFTMSMGDLATAPVHAKDEALVKALELLNARLAELPTEIGRQMPPELVPAFEADSIPIWMRLLTAQKRVSVMGLPEGSPNPDMPFLFSVAVDEPNEQAAIQYEASLKYLLTRMQAPFPLDMIQRDGSSIKVDMGAALAPMGQTRAAAMLGGGPMAFEMEMNIGGYLDFLKSMMMSQGAPPEAAMVFDILGQMGLDQSVMQAAAMSDGTTTHGASVTTGLAGRMIASGILPEGGLSEAHVAPVPRDATWANVARMDMEALFDAVDALVSEYAADQLGGSTIAELAQGGLGIDLRSGLFGALGDTYGMYAAESTGGGGVTSSVMFFSLRDAEALLQTKEQLTEIINAQVGAQSQGYVNIRSWKHQDDEYTTLMFPGLPVPLEPTMAMNEEWLVIAATPQAAMGAMAQIEGGGPSIGGNEEIAPLLDGTKVGVSFMDASFFARSGYGMTSMLLASVSNGVRSRTDEAREPGPIMPVYSTFKEGIRDMIGYQEVVGDDLITRQTQDGSTVVNLATMMGFMYDYGLVIMAPSVLGAAMPEIMRNF